LQRLFVFFLEQPGSLWQSKSGIFSILRWSMIQNYEEFTEEQMKILEHFVTSITSNIFVLRNLPEVIKGALFSRYSRSTLGLRSLLMKEFILNEDTSFTNIAGKYSDAESAQDQMIAIQKAQNFYDRILDGFGDDSIGELGGAHLAAEGVSLLATKMIEDCRLGGSPLEKSTRYIYFDQKMNGQYLFYHEPVLMTSAFRDLYLATCNDLFETYSRLIPPLTAHIEQGFPKDSTISKGAYTAALRAKVLDCLRGLLPASAMTNMGVFGNGRFFEALLQKMGSHSLAEMQDIGKKAHQELAKVIPSFIRRADPAHKHHRMSAEYVETVQKGLQEFAQKHLSRVDSSVSNGVRLIHADPDAICKVAGALLFSHGRAGLLELQQYCSRLPDEEIARLFDAVSACRENRRQKSPRALEHASFTFELVADFGAYRDLQRHRILTQERQLLTCNYGHFLPPEIKGTAMEADYVGAMDRAKRAYDSIAAQFPEEAQYIVPIAYNVHWYFNINLRSLQWISELRSMPQGHSTYRQIAQEMARQVCKRFPLFERFFKFVDFGGYQLGRLSAEIRKEEKMQVGEYQKK
jgi:thymidylate synthase ThyX